MEDCKPMAFASRVMSDTECRYAQFEREALTIAWVCEKFSTYIQYLAKHLPSRLTTNH